MNIQIRPEIEAIKDTIVSTRRDIHQHPELAFDEHRTSKLVADRLETLGIEVRTGVGKTGVVGTLNGKNEGKTIALRADMDALPIQETSNIAYKSKNDGIIQNESYNLSYSPVVGITTKTKGKNAITFKVNYNFNQNMKNIDLSTEKSYSEQITSSISYRKSGGLTIPIFFFRDFHIDNDLDFNLNFNQNELYQRTITIYLRCI